MKPRLRLHQSIPLSLLALTLSGPLNSAHAAEELPFRTVFPRGEAHELLPKTCGVCHKDDTFSFVIVASPTPEGLEEALKRLSASAVLLEGVARPKNPHSQTACLFCHMEQPSADADSAGLRFRTLRGEDVALGDVQRLCEMCHQGTSPHPQVLGSGSAAAALEAAGLPVFDGTVLCSTCHDMHNADVGPADVRLAYLEFATESPKSYVHGNQVGCLACHPTELSPGSDAIFRETGPTAVCTRCHDPAHGGIHPMLARSSEKTYPMDFLDYPLDGEGRLSCSTCHDHPCGGPAAAGDRKFLRGGPYQVATEFCYRCHPRAGVGSLNPHAQVDDAGRLVTTTCAFCHRTIPDADDPEMAYFGPEDLNFLHSPVELCMGCHEPGPHPTGINHLVEMTESRAEKLAEYERRHRVSLPLDGERRISCTTCHNPHAKGVLRGEAALGAGESHMWRVPSYAELCTPCHTRYD